MQTRVSETIWKIESPWKISTYETLRKAPYFAYLIRFFISRRFYTILHLQISHKCIKIRLVISNNYEKKNANTTTAYVLDTFSRKKTSKLVDRSSKRMNLDFKLKYFFRKIIARSKHHFKRYEYNDIMNERIIKRSKKIEYRYVFEIMYSEQEISFVPIEHRYFYLP